MKKKHVLTLMLVFTPLAAALRIIQYFTVIDSVGHFKPSTPAQTFLIYALYALLLLAALCALAAVLTGDKRQADMTAALGGGITGWLIIAAALMMSVQLGISIGGMMKTGTADIPSIIGIPAVIGLASLGLCLVSGKKPGGAVKVFGIFPPIYAVACGMSDFFNSFENAHVSESKFSTLAVCMLALLLITVYASVSGAAVSRRRLCAVGLLYSAVSSPCAIGGLIAILCGRLHTGNMLQIALNYASYAVFTAVCFIAVMNSDSVTQEPEDAVTQEPENGSVEENTDTYGANADSMNTDNEEKLS